MPGCTQLQVDTAVSFRIITLLVNIALRCSEGDLERLKTVRKRTRYTLHLWGGRIGWTRAIRQLDRSDRFRFLHLDFGDEHTDSLGFSVLILAIFCYENFMSMSMMYITL